MTTLTAAAADKRVGGKWFKGYTSEVTLVDEARVVDGYVAEDPEYAIYEHGLVAKGTVDLGRDVHSIIVVCGVLRAKRLILGDAVLVVTERVEASELVFGPPNEGIFQVAGQQIEGKRDKLLAAIDTPVLAIFDRGKREYVLRDRGMPRTTADLVADVLDMDEVDTRKLRARLDAGTPVFRGGAATPKMKATPSRPRAGGRPRPDRRR